MSKNILVVAAHMDDESLGCAGTIAKHINDGDRVYVVFLSDGVTSRNEQDSDDLAERLSSTSRAMSLLGVSEIFNFNLPDNRLDTVPLIEVVKLLEKVLDKIRPIVVYTHYGNDLNIDHKVAYLATMTACRPLPKSSVKEIYQFEVVSSTDWSDVTNCSFSPNFYVDISKFVEKKLEILKCYSIEMREIPHSRSYDHVLHLARHRGYSVGIGSAEAFVCVRVIR